MDIWYWILSFELGMLVGICVMGAIATHHTDKIIATHKEITKLYSEWVDGLLKERLNK